jgi:hypothetical protein
MLFERRQAEGGRRAAATGELALPHQAPVAATPRWLVRQAMASPRAHRTASSAPTSGHKLVVSLPLGARISKHRQLGEGCCIFVLNGCVQLRPAGDES